MHKLPDFVIAGERRSGSTTLYEILKQHPEIGMHAVSDLDYFIGQPLFSLKDGAEANDNAWERNHAIEGYEKLFDGLNGIVGHKDADLLWWRPSHSRMATHLPDTKFIFVLRNPAKRAESQYWNEFRKGRENSTFKEALAREEKAALTPWQQLHLQYKARGCYVDSLAHFTKHIPKDRVLVVVLENLFADLNNELKRICDFSGASSTGIEKLAAVHSNKEEVLVINPKYKNTLIEKMIGFYDRGANAIIKRIAKSKEEKNKLKTRFTRLGKISARLAYPISKADLKELSDFYLPFNKKLEDEYGVSTEKWKTYKA